MVLRVDPRRSLFPDAGHLAGAQRHGRGGAVGSRRATASSTSATCRTSPAASGASASRSPRRRCRSPGRCGATCRAASPSARSTTGACQVLWCARPVAGTDWWLVAKIDMDEVDAPAWERARETGLAALLALLGAALAGRLWSQRRLVREAETGAPRAARAAARAGTARGHRAAAPATPSTRRISTAATCSATAPRRDFVGRSVEDVLGRTNEELFGPETRGAHHARTIGRRRCGRADRQLRGGAARRRDGPVHLLATKGPLVDAEGTLLGILGVSRDVMAMREAQRALRESEAHHRAVVSALNEGIIVCDRPGRRSAATRRRRACSGNPIRDGGSREPRSSPAGSRCAPTAARCRWPSARSARVLAGRGPAARRHDARRRTRAARRGVPGQRRAADRSGHAAS